MLKPGEIRTVWDDDLNRTVVLRERDGVEYILVINVSGSCAFYEYKSWLRVRGYLSITTEYKVMDASWMHRVCDAIRSEARAISGTLRSKRLAGQRFP